MKVEVGSISEELIGRIQALQPEQQATVLHAEWGLDKPGYDERADIAVEVFLHCIREGNRLTLTDRQTARWCGIVREIFVSAFLVTEAVHATDMKQAFAQFQQLIQEACTTEPDAAIAASSGKFTVSQARALVAFMSSGLFRHYELYQGVFYEERELAVRVVSALVDQPLRPLPLASAKELKTSEA